jgi:hypothetical protein
MEVLFGIGIAILLARIIIPFFDALTQAVKEEADRVSREGLIKTVNGAFWSPDQELRPHHRH